jgi:hypothetical protein
MMYTFGDARAAPPSEAALVVEALVRERVLAVVRTRVRCTPPRRWC